MTRIRLLWLAVLLSGWLSAVVPAESVAASVGLSTSPATRATTVSGQIPDPTRSYFVPQAGPFSNPIEGDEAARFFRACPNNDGGSSLPNDARIKIVVRDLSGSPITGISAGDICVAFNGGTAAQGFSGLGADSIVANSTWNLGCPDVRCVSADTPTDGFGVTYITFTGSDGVNPGHGVRDAGRKWGHYDSELPVYVLGVPLQGRLTSSSASGTYTLRIKNMDWAGGLGTQMNLGEVVNISDFNGIANTLGVNNPMSYWKDLNGSGSVDFVDIAIVTAHLTHDCGTPNDP